jgi:uncharacterized protein (TIGR03435 family)
MKTFHGVRRNRTKLFFSMAASLLFAAAGAYTLLGATPNQAPPQQQSTSAPASAPAYEFETASIKPNKSNVTSFRPGFTPDGYRAEDTNAHSLIQQAYDVQDYQLSGISDWMNKERYDVEAKVDQSVADALSKLPAADLKLARQQMLQSLLAERFNLKIHRETKDGPVYFLTIGKNGPKLQDVKPRTTPFLNADGTPARGSIQVGPGMGTGGADKARAFSFSTKSFADWLATRIHRPVLDKTGLTGIYDFTLEWTPDAPPASSPDAATGVTLPRVPGASLFSAVQQLGLKLEPGKSPIEIIVIDHVERPSGN